MDRNKKYYEPHEQLKTLKESALKIKAKAKKLGGYAKKFYNIHKLKEHSSYIEYLKNWVWTLRNIINKQKEIKDSIDIRKYFTMSKKS